MSLTCSECNAAFTKKPGAGRPPETCGPACYRKRISRLKREVRAYKKACQEAESNNAAYLRDNEAFFKGGK